MRLVYLTDVFYQKYSDYPEIMKKPDRPYYCFTVQIDGIIYAIPIRHHIHHPFAFKTIEDRGLDYSKAVVIESMDYISDDRPWIDSREWNIIRSNEDAIFSDFRKYLNRYKHAVAYPDNPRNKVILQYSTLRYFDI